MGFFFWLRKVKASQSTQEEDFQERDFSSACFTIFIIISDILPVVQQMQDR